MLVALKVKIFDVLRSVEVKHCTIKEKTATIASSSPQSITAIIL